MPAVRKDVVITRKRMPRPLVTLVFCLISFVALKASNKGVIGSWEGESKCMVANSPCHDEHVLYQITEDRKDPWQLSLDTYEVNDGTPEFMGTLNCQYDSKAGALSCTSSTKEKDDWEFHTIGDTMAGRLLVDDGKTIYRRITLHRSPK
jgi:hypothetical protein